jgi:Zn-finger nucleic acid-binding protein
VSTKKLHFGVFGTEFLYIPFFLDNSTPLSIFSSVSLVCHDFFDKNELSRVYEHGRIPEKFLGASTPARDKIVCESCGTHNDRSERRCAQCKKPLFFLCPVCHKQMEEVPIGNVFIDRCKSCQGIWLDGGELTLLFNEFKQRKKEDLERVRSEGGNITNDLAAWVAIDTLDTLVWRPDLAYRTGEAIADVVTGIPGAVAGGVDAAVEGVSNIPEVAGDLAEGTVELASGAAEVASDVISNIPEVAGDLAEGTIELASGAAEVAGDVVGGAIDLAGEVPEIAGAVAEAGASFIEMLFEIIGSIFDS